jgi:tRNA-dihydrouridine synthase
MQQQFPTIDHWMIGRGLISDPFLPNMIKENTDSYPSNKNEIFKNFHQEIFEQYQEALSGSHHILLKMTSFWEYFATQFPDSHKTFKKIKKAKSLNAYHQAVAEILTIQKHR